MTSPHYGNNPQYGGSNPGSQGGSTAWGGQQHGGQQQYGGQYGQHSQHGQQYGQPQPYGGQQQYGAPHGQQQYGQPQYNQGPNQAPSQWGAPQPQRGGKSAGLPGWPTWAFIGLTILTLIGSFLPVASFSASAAGIGGVSFSVNWWGKFSYTGTGLGSLADGYADESLGTDGGMVVTAIAILLLYVAACVLLFLGRTKPGAIVGAIAGLVQLITVIVNVVQLPEGEGLRLGAGWYLWLLASIAALAIGILLLVKGENALGGGKSPKNQYGAPQGYGAPQSQWGHQGSQGHQHNQYGQPGQHNQYGQPGQQQWGQPGNQPNQTNQGQWGQQGR